MNLNGLDFEYASAQQAKAKAAFIQLPAADQAHWMKKAANKYRTNGWEYFSQEGKDVSALLEYIESLPEPAAVLHDK